MTTANLLFVIVGAAFLLIGLVTLIRPALVRALLGIRASEPATQGLLIAGMMITAFGLLLGGFAVGYTLSKPLDLGATN